MSHRSGTEFTCDGPSCEEKQTTTGEAPVGWGVHTETPGGVPNQYDFCSQACAGAWFAHRLWPHKREEEEP